MQTTIFEWAKERGISRSKLARKLDYSYVQLYRIATGRYPVTKSFMSRVILVFGESARSLFLDSVSADTNISCVTTDTNKTN